MAPDPQLFPKLGRGLDVFQWLTDPDTLPSAEYMASISVTIPLAALIQLMHVAVLYKTLGVTPVVAGHSQGIAIATAFSMLTDNESFEELNMKVLGMLLLVGTAPERDFPNCDPADSNAVRPCPMVQIQGIPKAALENLLAEFNGRFQADEAHVYLAITNTYDRFIIAGVTASVVQCVQFLRLQSASPDEDQSKMPFAKRKPVISTSYIGITAPYHCRLLEGTVDTMYGVAQRKGWVFSSSDMRLPVRAGDDGHDIRSEENLTRYLFESMCVLPVDFSVAISVPDVTHIVDFSAGGFSVFGQLAHRNVEGRGIPVICAGALVPQSSHAALGTKGDLYQRQLSDVVSAPNWLEEFGPRLVRTAHDGQVHIDTRMQRILGAPTVMVAGMLPTTVNEKFVAAINNAGYHAELAGGGIHTEADMEHKIKALAKSIGSGQGITLNCIYINPRQWSFQLTTLLRLRSEGLPIAGLCIGGGVPSFDAALEVIDSLRSAGIRHVSFKPSTAEAIRHVVKVAQASDGFPIVLQWTGGRAGGHHSYEDFHQPILETYAAIRACNNIALVAGSGFGDAEGTLPYLTGNWSIQHGRTPMPFDGILLASRVMVAKEAGTSLAAKELIVAAQGLPDPDWHQTYDGAHGGVTTVTTEFGELNHILATRAVIFLREIHKDILSQPREKHQALLLARKDEIISRLNRDYMRPWFGKKRDGRVVDLEDMTYAEVIDRLVELVYVKHQQRWAHPSYFQLVLDFAERITRRMCDEPSQYPFAAHLHRTDPLELGACVIEEYPAAATQLVAPEDVQFFIQLCKRRGQKPVPFIPVLDGDFGTLLLKDTAGQSEDIDAVVDQDPQRVGIQQGPVAARYSTTVNEPVKNILDGVYHRHISALLERQYGGDESRVPVVEYIGAEPVAVALPDTVHVHESAFERVIQLPATEKHLPELDVWLQALAGARKSWLRALLTSPVIVQGDRYAENYVRQMLRPRVGRTVTIGVAGGLPVSLSIADSAKTTELQFVCSANGAIHLIVYYQPLAGSTIQFQLEFQYCPPQALTPIHGSKSRDSEAMRRFFIDIWVGSVDKPSPYADTIDPDTLLENELVITEEHSRALCATVGNNGWAYGYPKHGVLSAPAEFTNVACIRSVLAIFQSSLFGAGQASIVHLSNKLTLADGVGLLKVGDRVSATTRIISLVNVNLGKKLTTLSTIYRNGVKYATAEASFLSRFYFIDPSTAFERTCGQKIMVTLPSETEVSVLELKEWLIYRKDTAQKLQPNTPIEFCLDSEHSFESGDLYSGITTTGTATMILAGGRRVCVADVDFEWCACTSNPVIDYLRRFEMEEDEQLFDNGGYSLCASVNETMLRATAPGSNRDYAKYSLDSNPFHLNPYIADFAGLPGTITHGLWTSASTRAIVERVVAGGHPERVRSYQTDFVDMVLPRDKLTTELFHVGMKHGRMLIRGQTSKVDGGPVMTFSAEIDQPPTAYVFTGQGSQEVGMGMDLYEQSPAAQAIWDRANAHMLSRYDIDLLDIVRTNPKQYTVYFGSSGGEKVRHNYLVLLEQSDTLVLPGITKQSTSYTFQSPTGLLKSTQFTQIALVANAMASVANLRSQGLVQKDALFSGHSLGEYAALAALGNVFSVEDVLDIVFYRGLIMQSAVPRDTYGRSEYGMVAVNPLRVSQALDEEALQAVVDRARFAGSGLLQVVNYNVAGQQYVVAGTLTNLTVLRMVLDGLQQTNVSDTGDIIPAVDRILNVVMSKSVDSTPMRGVATIPLDGVDVPFHSEQLAGQVALFRYMLQSKIHGDLPLLSELCGRYIPNLTAEPFELTREYFGRVYDVTQSPILKEALDGWDDTAFGSSSEKGRLACLLLVELLTYQLASPVQWIGTQEYLFENAGVQRVVEVGPSPVLCGMADRTLSRPEYAHSSVSVLHVNRDQDEVTYHHAEDPAPVSVDTPATPPALPENGPEPVPAPVLSAAPAEGSGAGAAKQIPDAPLQALDVIHAVVAFKLKQPLSAVSVQYSIKALVAGKSILQNEMLADLQKEFGNRMPDKPEDIGLQELGAAIGVAGSLGKCTQPLVTRMFSNKMPGGFTLNSARSTLESAYGLGPQRQDALLLVALTMEPALRLGSEAEATAWVDKVAKAYASRTGISYLRIAGAAGDAHAAGPVVSSAEMKKMQSQQHEYVRQQIEVLARQAGIDLRKDGRLVEEIRAVSSDMRAKLDALQAELGDDYAEGILPCFDARKARKFDSYWNWARQDAYEWIQQGISDCIAGTGTSVNQDRFHRLLICSDPGLLQLLSGSARTLSATNDAALKPLVDQINELHEACVQSLRSDPTYKELSTPTYPQVSLLPDGSLSHTEVERCGEPTFTEYIEHMQHKDEQGAPSLVHLQEMTAGSRWTYSEALSSLYFEGLTEVCDKGLSFAGKTTLVTGCGRGSIGAEVIRRLLMGGAKVLATTSSYSRRTTLFFEDMYRQFGARGSELILVPFNQGSVQDIEALVSYIFGQPDNAVAGLGWNLDFVIPFAAISVIGHTSVNIGSRPELAQRVALTNVTRLLGRIKTAKEHTGRTGRPALVIVPLSPNHGTIGGDGLYGECKIALEVLFNRWKAESWEGFISVSGASIGWTRGTSLTSDSNRMVYTIESWGKRTFSRCEMAFNILGLLHPRIASVAHKAPISADFSGGVGTMGVMTDALKRYRGPVEKSGILSHAFQDRVRDFAMLFPKLSSSAAEKTDMSPLARFSSHFPKMRSSNNLRHLHHLHGMVNLDKVVVITGYGEVSPHGNAETRWEMEAFGQLSTEGCIELAWIMGLIKHHNGQLAATGEHYVGWVDAKGGGAVRDVDIKPQYEEYILAHTGIRLIEPSMANGYNTDKKQILREIQIQHDMEPFEASAEDAAAYKKSNGDQVDIWENSDSSWSVRFLKGALLRVPASASATRLVAGQLPTGWSAERFGIPRDLIDQIDPATLYTLVAAAEALLRSGLTDPYELYRYFHVSEVGSSIGSTAGGQCSLQDMYHMRSLDKEIQNSTMQETFISTTQAWVNMLLMSSAGPVKPVAGACATPLLAIDTACETIQSGKARVMLAGGVDDFTEEGSTEFGAIGATSDTYEEYALGRTPPEMCRPCASSRTGLVEAQGASVAVLMSASAAMECGAPIYAVVAGTATATDKQGRSIPAPGKGILTSARGQADVSDVPLFSMDYRRQKLERNLKMLDTLHKEELDELRHSNRDAADMAVHKASMEAEHRKQRKMQQDAWGNEFWKQDPRIPPLRGSLAVWGLTADDIGLASFHGTGTKANDQNESEVLNVQMEQLGRTPGNVVPVVCQKWLAGHVKGGAAGLMLNGAIQSMRTGIIPGNRNADNIDPELKACGYALYLSKTVQTAGIKAALLKAFGFGQVSGELLIIHPEYVLAAMDGQERDEYQEKVSRRGAKSHRYSQGVLVENHPMVQVKHRPPYSPEQEQAVLLNPLVRAQVIEATGEYRFK
ncbi:fatty acid synthase alpha subunit Lsd1 [Coemansia sp. RSA 552]|nr:fatty acid synthase alpha subunit Lsd1 [Coemansia sp. RSA 552]